MKKILKSIAIVFVVAFIAIQFYRPDQMNPPIIEAETLEATVQVPENISTILSRSCNDCHSNKTVYPWYARITPSNWLLASHIEEGRNELNFSVWATYEARKKKRKLDEICEQVESGAMPYDQYRWIHRDAILTGDDKKLLCDWAAAEKSKINEPLQKD